MSTMGYSVSAYLKENIITVDTFEHVGDISRHMIRQTLNLADEQIKDRLREAGWYELVDARVLHQREVQLQNILRLNAAVEELVRKQVRKEVSDHKWLDPTCVQNGCQSLVLKHRAQAAEQKLQALGFTFENGAWIGPARREV